MTKEMATWRIETGFLFLLWCKVVFRRVNSAHYCSSPLHSLGSYTFYCLLIRLEGCLPWNPILESSMGQGICKAKVPRPTDAHIPPRLTPVIENPVSQSPMSLSPGSIHASVLWEGGLLVCVPLSLRGGEGTACIVGVNKAWMFSLESPQVWTRPLAVCDGDSAGKRREAAHRPGLSGEAQGLSLLGLHVPAWNPQASKTLNSNLVLQVITKLYLSK